MPLAWGAHLARTHKGIFITFPHSSWFYNKLCRNCINSFSNLPSLHFCFMESSDTTMEPKEGQLIKPGWLWEGAPVPPVLSQFTPSKALLFSAGFHSGILAGLADIKQPSFVTLSQQARLSVIPGLAKDKRSFPLTFTARQQYSQKLIPTFPVLCSLLPFFMDPIRSFDLSSMPIFLKNRKYFWWSGFPFQGAIPFRFVRVLLYQGGNTKCLLKGEAGSQLML